jgi:hypothetical protein
MRGTFDKPRATRREWIGLAVIATPCLLYAMDLSVLNLAVPALTLSSSDFGPGNRALHTKTDPPPIMQSTHGSTTNVLTENTAPCGSARTAVLKPGVSYGGTATLPPSADALDAAASVS